MNASFGIFALVAALFNGGANDLLDFVSSESYWKAKNVTVSVEQLMGEFKTEAGADISALVRQLGAADFKERDTAAKKILSMGPAVIPQLEKLSADEDAETANRAKALVQELQINSKAGSVRKLMAIRTLGEMKKAEALPVLKAQLDSKEMFIADYAARSIAQIEGKPLPSRAPSAEALKTDLNVLPANVGFVGQTHLKGDNVVDIAAALKAVPQMPGENREQALQMLTAAVIQIADQVGNVRVEGATFGLADVIDDNNGFFTAVIRAKYDAKAATAAAGKQGLPIETVDGVTVIAPDRHAAFALVSNDRIIFTTGPSQEKMPTKEMIAAVKENKGGLATNANMTKLIASVDTSALIWAVANIGPAYKQAPVINAFNTITLVGKQGKDQLDLSVNGTGSDAQQVKTAIDTISNGLNEARREMPRMVQQMPAFKPIADFMESIKVNADGAKASLTASFKGDGSALMGLPMFMFGARAHAEPVPAVIEPPRVVEEVKPVEVKPEK